VQGRNHRLQTVEEDIATNEDLWQKGAEYEEEDPLPCCTEPIFHDARGEGRPQQLR
jgi:hypothetical protein